MTLTVEQLLNRYGIEVRYLEPGEEEPKGFSGGPRVVGYVWPNTVVVPEGEWWKYRGEKRSPPAATLHEGMHLVCAGNRGHIEWEDEADGLLQVEYAAAKLLSARAQKDCDEYRGVTAFGEPGPRGEYSYVSDWKRPTATKWWRAGFKLAVRRGLLNTDGRLTWRRRRKART